MNFEHIVCTSLHKVTTQCKHGSTYASINAKMCKINNFVYMYINTDVNNMYDWYIKVTKSILVSPTFHIPLNIVKSCNDTIISLNCQQVLYQSNNSTNYYKSSISIIKFDSYIYIIYNIYILGVRYNKICIVGHVLKNTKINTYIKINIL